MISVKNKVVVVIYVWHKIKKECIYIGVKEVELCRSFDRD